MLCFLCFADNCSLFYKLKVSGYSADKFWCHFSNIICLLCVIFGDSCSISNSDYLLWWSVIFNVTTARKIQPAEDSPGDKHYLAVFFKVSNFFRHSAIAYLIYHSINICTGKHKKFVTHFVVIVALLWWSGSQPAVSPRYAWNPVRWRAEGEIKTLSLVSPMITVSEI